MGIMGLNVVKHQALSCFDHVPEAQQGTKNSPMIYTLCGTNIVGRIMSQNVRVNQAVQASTKKTLFSSRGLISGISFQKNDASPS